MPRQYHQRGIITSLVVVLAIRLNNNNPHILKLEKDCEKKKVKIYLVPPNIPKYVWATATCQDNIIKGGHHFCSDGGGGDGPIK